MSLKDIAKWEYEALVSDVALQRGEFAYPGGFEAWYKDIFLQDEAWDDIRREAKLDRVQ